MKISYLSSAAAVLALALTQTSGAGTLTLNNIDQGTIGSVSINSAGDMTVTTTSSTPPAPGVPVCSLGASATNIEPTQTSTLTANCSNSPTSYTWTASSGAPAAPAGASNTIAFPNVGSFTYSVFATNGTGSGNSSNSVTINVAAASTSGDPTCPAPPLAVTEIDQSRGTKKTYIYGTNQVRAVRFTAGNNTFGSVGWIIPSGTTPVSQLVSISRCPGDFTKTYPCGSTGTQNTLWTTNGAAASYLCPLTAGQVYYVNVRNGISTAASGVTVELK
jgi:hypothetical protein